MATTTDQELKLYVNVGEVDQRQVDGNKCVEDIENLFRIIFPNEVFEQQI